MSIKSILDVIIGKRYEVLPTTYIPPDQKYVGVVIMLNATEKIRIDLIFLAVVVDGLRKVMPVDAP